ncbi:outer membrane protein [Kordiimonas lacus]|uniref:Outer membrane protein beta-barrel domain-containing protein n=1 Tax=Kordiimonas lacus TaxID=637679 RepID=A0A1G6VID6_9PROT|nr:outer membrane beta-barrel protein [Kordiimonas lacus]SDD53382.1 Outer membrane protein beta-barrel domain-containing protein [Kordiimonas lacus]
MKKLFTVGVMVLTTAVSGVALADAPQSSTIDTKYFHGPYLGVEAGLGMHTEHDSSDLDFQFGLFGGYRHQSDDGLVLGLEGTFGFPGTPDTRYAIFPRSNRHHWSVMSTAGYAFGRNRRNLLFGQVGWSQVRQRVDLLELIDDGNGNLVPTPSGESLYRRLDGLKLGLGYERALSERLSLRTTVTFSGLDGTNDMLESSLGIVFKF